MTAPYTPQDPTKPQIKRPNPTPQHPSNDEHIKKVGGTQDPKLHYAKK